MPQRLPHRFLLGLLLGAIALTGCDCDDGLNELSPHILVTPERIDMGRRVVGQLSQAGFLVGNEGTAPVDVISYEIGPLADEIAAEMAPGESVETSGAAFAVVDGPATVAALRSVEGQLSFSPAAQAFYGGTLIVRSDDLERPVLEIPIVGEGGPPLIEADPSEVSFGVVNEGPGASRIVRLKNVGFDVLHISDVSIEGSAFSLNPEQATAADVAVGDELSVEVRMNPTEAAVLEAGSASLSGTLVALSDAENEPRLEVPLTGEANLAPRAVAVELVTRLAEVKVSINREVIIDGSDTVDPEGDAFTFGWTLVEKPADSTAILLGNTVAGACSDDTQCNVGQGYRCVAPGTCKQVAWTRVTPDAVGTYVVRLRATDERGAFREADARILPRDLAVVLTWETISTDDCYLPGSSECEALSSSEQRLYCCGQSDLDLHFVRPSGSLGDYGSCPAGCCFMDGGSTCVNAENEYCYEHVDDNAAACRHLGSDCAYSNPYPEWFAAGRADDPRLDIDDVRGFGPEIVTLNEPDDGTYTVAVHYFTDRIGEPTVARVDVYVKGALFGSAGPQLMSAECDAWIAGTLLRSGGPQDGAWQFVHPPDVFDLTAGPALCE